MFGVAVLVALDRAWTGSRRSTSIRTPCPGLLPGLLGIVMILLGVLLALRSWRRGGAPRRRAAVRDRAASRCAGSALVIGLILVYTVVLLGRGLPFWLGAALYVTASIVLLQAPQRARRRSRR